MIMDIFAVIGITFLILDIIVSFYRLIIGNKQEKLKVFIQLIIQIIMLYSGYRVISFFNN